MIYSDIDRRPVTIVRIALPSDIVDYGKRGQPAGADPGVYRAARSSGNVTLLCEYATGEPGFVLCSLAGMAADNVMELSIRMDEIPRGAGGRVMLRERRRCICDKHGPCFNLIDSYPRYCGRCADDDCSASVHRRKQEKNWDVTLATSCAVTGCTRPAREHETTCGDHPRPVERCSCEESLRYRAALSAIVTLNGLGRNADIERIALRALALGKEGA